MIRRLVGSGLCLLFLVLFAGGLASPASAHAVLTRTDPPSGGVLATAPATVTLSFTEAVRPVAERIRVIAPDKSRADTGPPTASGTQVTIPLRAEAARGTYLVTYRVISSDSHPIAGTFTFSVGAPSSQPPTASDAASERADPVVRVALGTARWLGYAGLVLLTGALLFLARLWPQRLSRLVPARLVVAGLITLTVSTVAEMYLQAPYTAGTGLFGAGGTALRDALSGTFGSTHVVRLAVLAAIAVLVRPFLRPSGPSTVDLGVLSFLAVIGLGTWPLSGHPAASPAPAVSMVADAAHLAAMAGWLGGLVMLAGVLLRRATGRELAAILPVWSSWAMLAVVTLALTGLAQSIIEVASVSALFDTGYGRLVLAKATLLAVVVGIAWFSRRMVGRIVAKADEAAGTLRRTVFAELAVTGVVLALAAALVQAPPARTADDAPAQPYTVTLTSDLYVLRLELQPGEVGGNTLHLFAFESNGTPKVVLEWKVAAAPVDASIEPLTVPILPITNDHATAEPTFPSAGEWELRLTLRTSDVDQATVSHRVTIKE